MAGVKKLHYLLCSQKVATSMGGMGQLEVALFDVVHMYEVRSLKSGNFHGVWGSTDTNNCPIFYAT